MQNEGGRLTEEPIAAEKKEELDALVNEYIPHRTWVEDIQQLATQLQEQADEITESLKSVVNFYIDPISNDGEVWFDAYKLVSRELVRKALKNGLYGSGEIPEDNALEEDDRFRAPLGLYSGLNSLPDREFEQKKVEFHLAQLLVDAMIDVQADVLVNPLYVDQLVVEGEEAKTFDAAEPGLQKLPFTLSLSSSIDRK